MIINLEKKVAVVTGGAKGIGKIISNSLLNEGMMVAIWDLNDSELTQTVDEFEKDHYGRIIGINCDVSKHKDVENACRKTLETFKTIDTLVANAGIVNKDKVSDLNEEDWDKVFNTNTKGVFLCAKVIAEVFKKKNNGRIIIASSFASIIPSVGAAAYSASKSAVNSLTRVLSAELGPWNITVNAYAPGMIPTEMLDLESIDEERREKMLNSLSIREWGKPEDIASLVIFLASEKSRYITGTLIDASGGKFSVQFNEFARDK